MKYGNKKVVVDGIRFDSKDEAAYYMDLKEMQKKGEVKEFKLQPKMILIPSFKKNGKTIRALTYTPDFLVRYADDKEVFIDVKGFSTDASLIRKKVFDYTYPQHELKWIAKNKTYGDSYGWIDKEELEKIKRKNKKAAKEKLK